MRSPNTLSRFWFLYGGILLVAVISVWRLFSLQIVHGEEYRIAAERQYVRPAGGVFDRGAIYLSKRDGTLVSAATTARGGAVIVNNTKLADRDAAYRTLATIVPLDRSEFDKKTADANDTYIELLRKVSEEDAATIRKAELSGITIEEDRWRVYPGGKLAAHTIGFMGYDGNTLTGRYGLERYYNDVLARRGDTQINFFAEMFGELASVVFERKPREGDIVTTIEPTVQTAVEDSLEKIWDTWRPQEAGAIVMDPKTGAIYAMASLPRFDLNNFRNETDAGVFSNPLVENVYEMGSTVKPLVMAAGLDAGVVTAKTTFDDKGVVVVDSAHIRNFDGKARGVVPMQEVLNQSLNTGMAFVTQRLGNDRTREYLLKYGIGQETGIDLPGEVHGIVDNLESPRDVEYVTASFGQGIAMTPIEITRALASLGNGGLLVNPHVVKEIKYTIGPKTTIVPNPPKRILKQETSEEITRMLVTVVDDALAHGTVKLPNHSIAAKTGTAQIARPDGRGYYEDRYLHSFFGYFPAYDPQFIVFYYQVYPKGAKYASETLTKPFMDTAKFLLNYYQVPPDR